MGKINLLSKETIDKIAAGEVVERPSSIVKELVENCVDAGANAITVEIREGGISFIRVTDNGEGIEKDQIRSAFLRHATSKIERAEDLLSIASLGFRGEALSSISAVSQMEVITKRQGDLTGVRYVIEGGSERSFEEIGAPEGSTFLVRNVFYNTPARKKFLKSAATEAGYIGVLMERLALSHPEISFKFINAGQVRLHTSGNHNLKDIIYSVYGREFALGLLRIEHSGEAVRVEGFIGKPELSRGNRSYENYFVNGRYVKSPLIARAIEEAYGNHMMQRRYPFTALNLILPGDQVDVNVHPTKQEVRFSNEALVYETIVRTLRSAIEGKELIRRTSVLPEKEVQALRREELQENKKQLQSAPEPFEKLRRDLFARQDSPYQPRYDRVAEHSGGWGQGSGKESVPSAAAEATTHLDTFGAGSGEGPVPSPAAAPAALQQTLFEEGLLSKSSALQHRIIGQLFDTYWLIEFRDSLYIIDQHAAHEKVMYERLLKRMEEKKATSQQISPPLILTLNLGQEDLYRRYEHFFTDVGFEIEPFGGKEYAVRAVPDNLYGFTDKELFIEMLDSLSDVSASPSPEFLYEKLSSMACKAAVKGNSRLSVQEASALIGELLELDNPYNCPHGRPTIIAMSRYELEKKFRRIV